MDGLVNSIYFQPISGNIHDVTIAVNIPPPLDILDSTILPDKDCGTSEILDYIQHQKGGAIPLIQRPLGIVTAFFKLSVFALEVK